MQTVFVSQKTQSKLLNLWHHDLEVSHTGLLTDPCSCPPAALVLDAFPVLLNLPPVSFTPVFFDDNDDKSFTEYLLYARHCLNVETQLLH